MGKAYFLNLSLFDDGGAASGASGGNASAPAAPASDGQADAAKSGKAAAPEIVYGKPPADEAQKAPDAPAKADQVDYDAEFDKLIKGDYKSPYEKRMQTALRDRFKRADADAKQLGQAQKVLDAMALRYGVDPNDHDALMDAFDSDKTWLQQEALQTGRSEEEVLEHKQLLRDRAQLQSLREQMQFQSNLSSWTQQAEALKATFPDLDLRYEMSNPETGRQFFDHLNRGNTVEDAYWAIHKHDIMSGLVQHTAQEMTAKVTNDIKARGLRPSENGASGAAPAKVYKTDPSAMDDKELDRVRKIVENGGIVRF